MAHIHLPDGAFSIYWAAVWFAVAAVVIGILIWRYRKVYEFDISSLSKAAILAAFAFAVFQIEVPIFGGVHLSLTPLLGIMLGPLLGCASVLVVNVFSAALGHGGWSLIGANFLINSIEVTASFFLFLLFSRTIKNKFSQSTFSVMIALIIGNIATMAVVGVSGIQGSYLTSTEIVQNLLPLVTLNLIVAVIEALITGFTVVYISQVKPDLLPNTKMKKVGGGSH